MKNKVIPYGRQSITDEDIQAVVAALRSDYLTQGPTVEQFEKDFAAYIGSRYALAVANGTVALHLGAIALGVRPGDKVITTPITFAASANCVTYCGGEVVFSDIEPTTYVLDVEKVRQLLKAAAPGTYRGIIPVAFAGLPVNLEAFRDLADEFGLWIMEDACHAPGAWFKDSKGVRQAAGGAVYSDLSVFSFHPVKHIATGEGGMITTNNETLYKKIAMLRTHGIVREGFINKIPDATQQGAWYYEMQDLGYNYRITDIQCALGISQLKRASANLTRRNELAQRYRVAFDGTKIGLQYVPSDQYHAYHLFVVEVDDRKGLYGFLRSHGIFAQVHYIPVHYMPYYQKRGFRPGDFPVAERYYERCLSLPLYPTLTNDEQDFVIDKVLTFVE
ncbi:MAG: UDP-4-amino-4,6-dideoxy-N-acetyl-beta-L-altrosamine transaminase [Bacteroidota bacterium]